MFDDNNLRKLTDHPLFWYVCLTLSVLLAVGGVVYVGKTYGW